MPSIGSNPSLSRIPVSLRTKPVFLNERLVTRRGAHGRSCLALTFLGRQVRGSCSRVSSCLEYLLDRSFLELLTFLIEITMKRVAELEFDEVGRASVDATARRVLSVRVAHSVVKVRRRGTKRLIWTSATRW